MDKLTQRLAEFSGLTRSQYPEPAQAETTVVAVADRGLTRADPLIALRG